MDVEETLRAYEQDPSAESTIRKVITDAYQGLEPELQAINKYETEQLPAFYDAFSGYGMGTGAADIDPTTRMQIAANDVARKSALARTARNIFSTNQAGMEDLIGSAYNQWQTGYGMAQNAWDRDFKNRQLALQRSSLNRTPSIITPPQPTQTTPSIEEIQRKLQVARNLEQAELDQTRIPQEIQARSSQPIVRAGNWLGNQLDRVSNTGYGQFINNLFGR